MDKINLGILGNYNVDDIICDDDFDSDEEFYAFIEEVFNNYNNNIESINKKILYQMYYALSSCAFPIWEEEEMKQIVDLEKLPSDFYNLPDSEKSKTLYGFDFNEDNIIEMLNSNVPFLDINKFKNIIRISNVYINKNLHEINIEFYGFCKFFNAMITLIYNDGFRVSDFHAS